MKFRHIYATVVAALVLAIAGCGGGGGGGSGGGIGGTGISTTLGTLRVSVTDAPACGYDAVYVSIAKVRVHRSSSADDGDAGWSEVVLSPARRVDLLSLTNGVLEELGQTQLPPGKYNQMRMVLAENTPSDPFANAVIPTGGALTALTTPSATQSGLKIKLDLVAEAGKVTDLILDFDACKSVVRRGNSGEYNLKPVITATTLVSDAGMRVVGYVDPALGVGSTQVSVQSAGVPVKATVPDASGRFVLYPVPAGNYDLVVSAEGRVTAVMTGVPVTADAITTVNSAAVPIVPGVASMRTVSGTVAPATATVRATQTLNGGPTVETAWAGIDAATGAFSAGLPIGAPVKTAYAANPASLGFVADPTAAGRYTLEAASGGAVKTQAIDAAGAVSPIAFTFP